MTRKLTQRCNWKTTCGDLDTLEEPTYFELGAFPMFYIQIPDTHRAEAFLLLVKSGFPVACLAGKIYGVREEHLKILRRKRIPF